MPFAHKEKLKPPPYLHYCRPYDDFAVEILKERKLFLKSPKDFNDPFDCSAFALRRGTAGYYKRSFKHDLAKKHIREEQKERIRSVLKAKLYEQPQFWDEVMRGMQLEAEKFGVFSFTERPDNFLLWSYYADKHNGICFGFEMRHMPDDLRRVMKVRYVKKRPIVGFSNQNDYHSIFDTKSLLWKHEREWRAVANGKARTHVHFDDKALTAVLCGIGMEGEKVREVANFCAQFHPKPKLYKGHRAVNSYKIQFQQVKYED